MTKKIVFLDLEDTVIDDFSKAWGAIAMNHVKVAEFLEKEQPDEVRVFSFAISSEKDVHAFDQVFKPWLERSLGFPIQSGDKLFTTRKLFDLAAWKGAVYENETECMLFHGKALGFMQFVRWSDEFRDCELVLVDDAIGEPMNVEFPSRGLTLRLVDIADL